jgi:16S rRNA (cytidine1402-2'-O)-methyltransferase
LAITNAHTEFGRTAEVLSVLADGRDVAVVSDAGTPGISDPGAHLVTAAIDAGYGVSAAPGPVAAITALIISGLPTDRFVFEGFLPRRGGDRHDRLASIATEERTVIVYEAPHRVLRSIADLSDVCGGERFVVVCRELTKLHETVVRGPIGSIDLGDPRGEYVIVLAGAAKESVAIDDDTIVAALRSERSGGASTRDSVTVVAERLGVPRRVVYALAIADR